MSGAVPNGSGATRSVEDSAQRRSPSAQATSSEWRTMPSPSMSTVGSSRSSHSGQVPGGSAEQEHHRGHERHPDQERVEQDADGERERDRLDRAGALGDERREDEDHDQRGGRDDADAARRSRGARRLPVVAGVRPRLPHAGDDEDLVVHRQAEQDRDAEDRQEAEQRPRLDVQQARAPAPLEDGDGRADARRERQQEADARPSAARRSSGTPPSAG